MLITSYMIKKKVLINAANLHHGGGLQVAISFIYELTNSYTIDLSYIHVVASDEVDYGLRKIRADCSRFGKYNVVNTYGLQALKSHLNRRIKNYDVIFTVFGPNYLRVKANREIVGFAQMWTLSPKNPVSSNLSLFKRILLRNKLMLQWLFFLRADHFIVELEHVKKGLINVKKIPEHKVSVVYNTVSSIYNHPESWKSIKLTKGKEDISLGIITKDYPHKNLRILPEVAQIMKSKYDLQVHFYVTLDENEYLNKDNSFKNHVSTIGVLLPHQCPSFYKQIDGVIFPSLLECFSVTPLEATVMERPLFASDYDFIRDICLDNITYINPLDAEDIAYEIATYFQSTADKKPQLLRAKEHALNFSNAKDRANKYIQIINNYLSIEQPKELHIAEYLP